jgi:hypothetical protein
LLIGFLVESQLNNNTNRRGKRRSKKHLKVFERTSDIRIRSVSRVIKLVLDPFHWNCNSFYNGDNIPNIFLVDHEPSTKECNGR